MRSDDAFAELTAATTDYRAVRESLAYHRGLARHGMANNLVFAVTAEHTAFCRWERAHAAFEKLKPATAPKPTPAPKVAAAANPPQPVPVVSPKVASVASTNEAEMIHLRAEHDALHAALVRNANEHHTARERLYSERRAQASARLTS